MQSSNIFVITSSAEYWEDVALSFEEKGFIPSVWIGDYRQDPFARKRYPECAVLPIKEFHTLFPTEETKYVPSAEYLRSEPFLRMKNQAMKLMDRQDETRIFARLERDAHFYAMFNRLYSLIIEKDIKFLVAGEAPHSSGQLLAYRICESLGIPTYHLVSNIYVPLLQINTSLVGKPIPVVTKPNVDQQISIIVDQFETYRNGIPTPLYMKQQADFDHNYNFVREVALYWKHLIALRIKPLMRIGFKPNNDYHLRRKLPMDANQKKWLFPFVRRHLLQALATEYAKYAVKVDLNDPKFEKFVYFPMPYEPERTSNPDGGDFYESIDALIALRNFVPADIPILVKEHPSQFSNKLQGFQARSPLIYQVLAKLENVTLVDISVPSAALVEKSEFVSCITGTAALEAALTGGKGLIFGTPWFYGLPGIHHFDEIGSYEKLLKAPTFTVDEIKAAVPKISKGFTFAGIANYSVGIYFERKFGDLLKDLVDDSVLVESITASIEKHYKASAK
jgi:hypothetical protein